MPYGIHTKPKPLCTMKKALHIFVIVTILASCSSEYVVEDELYSCLTKEFSKHSLDLDKTLDTLEILYIYLKV